jgi:hypothetical protein
MKQLATMIIVGDFRRKSYRRPTASWSVRSLLLKREEMLESSFVTFETGGDVRDSVAESFIRRVEGDLDGTRVVGRLTGIILTSLIPRPGRDCDMVLLGILMLALFLIKEGLEEEPCGKGLVIDIGSVRANDDGDGILLLFGVVPCKAG